MSRSLLRWRAIAFSGGKTARANLRERFRGRGSAFLRMSRQPGTRLVTANALTLSAMLGTTPEGIESRFKPLLADSAKSTELRRSYQNGRDLPLIGISWWSSHFGKDLPTIETWAVLVKEINAIFVNIQYGDVSAHWEVLKQAAPGRVLHDESVNQLVDMDGFASQLGALDAVVTISNTGAHLAGGMGLPFCLIRDDWFRRGWPVLTDQTPWYPGAKVFGKDGRPWEVVFDGVKEHLESNPFTALAPCFNPGQLQAAAAQSANDGCPKRGRFSVMSKT